VDVETGKINPLNLIKQSSCKGHITATDIENPDQHAQAKALDARHNAGNP
jgi:hypothetical protein